jgi:hypothetical protein
VLLGFFEANAAMFNVSHLRSVILLKMAEIKVYPRVPNKKMARRR